MRVWLDRLPWWCGLRELIRRRWTYPATGRQRGLDPEVVELVLRLARDNARWGFQRIAGECRKLGVSASATSVRTILRRTTSARHPAATVLPGRSSSTARLRERWRVTS